MTERDWEGFPSTGRALQLVNRLTGIPSVSKRRRLRLYTCHALRLLQPLVTGDRFTNALDLAEQHFDGLMPLKDLQAAVACALKGYELRLGGGDTQAEEEGSDDLIPQCLTQGERI